MPIMMEELGLNQLSVEDRWSLIDQLFASIVAEPDSIPITEAQKADIDSRLEAYRDNPKAGAPWAEVKARLQRKRS